MLTGGLQDYSAGHARASESVLPAWFRARYETAEPFEHYRRRVRVVGVVSVTACVAFAMTVMGWVMVTDGSPVIGGIPSAALIIAAVGALAMLVRVGAQLPHLRERRTARRLDITVFAVGSVPVTRTYLVVDAQGLHLSSGRGRPLGSIRNEDLEVTAVRSSAIGVGLTLSIRGEWFDVPIALMVGGPAGSAWSAIGAGSENLCRTVAAELQSHAPVYVHEAPAR